MAVMVLGDCHRAQQPWQELEFPTSSRGDSCEFQKSQPSIPRMSEESKPAGLPVPALLLFLKLEIYEYHLQVRTALVSEF